MKILGTIIGLLFCIQVSATTPSQVYLDKFKQFMLWEANLPTTAPPEFIAFIQQTTPLSKKIRGRFLYQLALNKDWKGFLTYYQPSNDVSLQCYEQLALIHEGQEEKALPNAKSLWLQSHGQPPSCDNLFSWLLKTHDPDKTLITQRIIIALENRNLSLATYLLNQYNPPHTGDSKILNAIHQQPKKIIELSPGGLHGDFYVYGLKRMVLTKMDEAIRYWQLPKAKQLLNEKQNQSFLSFLVLYKAMRDNDDTEQWFAKIKPQYYTELLLDWEIRYALKHQKWKNVEALIHQSSQKNEPNWQYWLARALEAQGKTTEANSIYESLAKTRHYYGFLASLRIKTSLSFANEPIQANQKQLHLYQPILDKIKTLYTNHHVGDASRLVNDFASELPKDDKSAFIQWIQNTLKWHGKAVYLSNMEDLNNQLTLRFPLVHQKEVTSTAKQYQIPPELVYAVIRQESSFREDAISPAGAHGLMQLMPTTAQKVAKQQKISYKDKKQLFSCIPNIKIGTAYLQQLDRRFKHHPVLIAAAYNAGPTQVNYWLKNHMPKDIDIWIETLPWRETRNYLKNIIAFYAVYQFRIQGKGDLSWFMQAM